MKTESELIYEAYANISSEVIEVDANRRYEVPERIVSGFKDGSLEFVIAGTKIRADLQLHRKFSNGYVVSFVPELEAN